MPNRRRCRRLLAWRGDEGQGQEVGSNGNQRTALLGVRNHGRVIEHAAGNAGLLEDDAVDGTFRETQGKVSDLDFEAERLGTALDDGNGLREAVCVEDGLAILDSLVLVGSAHHEDGFGHCGCFIQ